MVNAFPTLKDLAPGKPIKAVVPQKLSVGTTIKGTRKPGLFKVLVPSRDGMTLEIKTTAGVVQIFNPDGLPAMDAKGQEIAPAKEVSYDIPDGTFGWMAVTVGDSASYEVSAKLLVKGHARDKDGTMLVPWNFFYFPFTKVEEEGTNHPSAKWQRRFGGQANDWEKTSYWKSSILGQAGKLGHGITKAFVEEYNKWAGKQLVDYDNTWWWGHCDAAATASALFKQPKPNGDLSESDIEYFATEIAMCGYSIDCKFFLGGLGNNDRRSPSHTEKPEERIGQALDGDLGPFHEALIDVIKKQGGVALMDMRAEWKDGKDQSPDVWNQACYRFTMEAKQSRQDTGTADAESNARSLEFRTILFANADAHDSGGNPEAPAGSGWNRELTYVLHYDATGKVAINHPQNNWKKCFWEKTGKEYYAPRYIFQIKGLNPASSKQGNPHITYEKAKELGLALRPAFGG